MIFKKIGQYISNLIRPDKARADNPEASYQRPDYSSIMRNSAFTPNALGISPYAEAKPSINAKSATTAPISKIDKDVIDTIFSEVGNKDTANEAVAMYLSMVNRAKRISEHTGQTYNPAKVVAIPDQYIGRTTPQYKNAQSGSFDFPSQQKYKMIQDAISSATSTPEFGDYDSFNRFPDQIPRGADYKKIGEHYFYKAPGGLRTK